MPTGQKVTEIELLRVNGANQYRTSLNCTGCDLRAVGTAIFGGLRAQTPSVSYQMTNIMIGRGAFVDSSVDTLLSSTCGVGMAAATKYCLYCQSGLGFVNGTCVTSQNCINQGMVYSATDNTCRSQCNYRCATCSPDSNTCVTCAGNRGVPPLCYCAGTGIDLEGQSHCLTPDRP
jgi:hypothetical protein